MSKSKSKRKVMLRQVIEGNVETGYWTCLKKWKYDNTYEEKGKYSTADDDTSAECSYYSAVATE